METCYDSVGRWYKTPNGYYPSVTTVLKILSDDAINAWRERVGEQEADRVSSHARERGTAMHDVLEHFCLGKPIPEDHQEAVWLAKQIIPKLERSCNKVYCVETPLWSQTLKTAGRMDLAGEWDGVPSIIDFKTSRKPKKEAWIKSYHMQATVYSVALWQRVQIETQQVVILIANDQNDPQVFKRKAPDMREFLREFVQVRRQFVERYGCTPKVSEGVNT